MTRTNTPWRPSEFERARQLREEGLSWREVGERLGKELGRSPHACVMRYVNWEKILAKRKAQKRERETALKRGRREAKRVTV